MSDYPGPGAPHHPDCDCSLCKPTIPDFQLLQRKYAVRMEKLGMKHSSGRSVRRDTAIKLGLKASASHDEVIKEIQRLLDNSSQVQS